MPLKKEILKYFIGMNSSKAIIYHSWRKAIKDGLYRKVIFDSTSCGELEMSFWYDHVIAVVFNSFPPPETWLETARKIKWHGDITMPALLIVAKNMHEYAISLVNPSVLRDHTTIGHQKWSTFFSIFYFFYAMLSHINQHLMNFWQILADIYILLM